MTVPSIDVLINLRWTESSCNFLGCIELVVEDCVDQSFACIFVFFGHSYTKEPSSSSSLLKPATAEVARF